MADPATLDAPPTGRLPASGDPFAGIDPFMAAAPAAATAPDPDDPFADAPPLAKGETGAPGAFISHAARGVLPMVGGMAAAGAGAEIGAGIGALTGPFAPVAAPVGGFIGGLAGFFAGSAATETAQDWALKQLPMAAQEAAGQSERAQREQEIEHPYASFMGGIAPYAITMSPGGWTKGAASLPENATTFQKIMANPLTAKAFSGAMMGGMELGNEWTEGQPTDWAKVGISTGFGLIFSHPYQHGEYLTNLGAQPVVRLFSRGMEVPPAGVLNPEEPTVAQAGDVGVIGPGITEHTFRGGEQQSDATRASAQNAAADEQAALGPLPTPDLDAIARRLDPDTFAQNDELLAQRDALRSWIQTESNPTDDMIAQATAARQAIDDQLAETKNRAEQRRLRVQQRAAQADLDDLTNRREAWENGTHVDTPDISMARQHLLDTEHALWDLAPDISAARRRAADHVGEEPEPAAQEVAAGHEQPAAEVPEKGRVISEPAAPAEKSPDAQRAFIAQDRATQLMAAGLSKATAEASAAVEAHYYATLAARFNGALGTAEDLYRARAARVIGPGQTAPAEGAPPAPITRTEPLRSAAIRSIADIQAQDGVGAKRAKAIQEQEILARGRVIEPGTPRGEPVVPAVPQVPSNPSTSINPAPVERAPELAEAAQVAPPVPEPRPRLRSAADIMREDRVPESRVKAVQDAELAALADWQARHPSGEPRPKRNRAADRLAETAGIPTAGVPEPAVLTEIVDRLPEERVVEEVNAAAEAGEIEYREAEAEAPEATETPDAFYDADQSRSLEELESEHRPAAQSVASTPEPASLAALIPEPERRESAAKGEALAKEGEAFLARAAAVEREKNYRVGGLTREIQHDANLLRDLAAEHAAGDDRLLEKTLDRLSPLRVGKTAYQEIGMPEVRDWENKAYEWAYGLEERIERARPANEAAAPEQREGGGGEPIVATSDEGQVPEGGGPVGTVGGTGERVADEGGERGDVEHAVAAAGVGPDYRPEPAAEQPPEPAGAEQGTGVPQQPAGVRRTDARGNPIFAKGERVVIPDGEHLAGRHGTVEEANGLVFQSLYGGQKTEPTYTYQVRTDAGELVHSNAPVAETGERPEVVPDPIYQGHARNPAELLRHIGLDERAATGYVTRGARARTPKMKAEWAREAANSRDKAAAQRAVLDAWATEHPEEAAKVLPARAAVPETPSAASTTPVGGMSIVETRHTKHGYPLWSVTLSGERLPLDRFNELRGAAREGGGDWSSWRGRGAVPGFQFRTREAAEAFRERFGGEGPAAEAPAPATSARPEWTEAGQNDRGETIYTNAEGAHSVIENGVRVIEGVALRPVRDERTGRISYVPQIKAPGSKELRYEVVPEAPTVAEVTEQAGGSESLPPQPAPAPETPKVRTISDALAPAEGKGPAPVTSAPEEAPRASKDVQIEHAEQMPFEDAHDLATARRMLNAYRGDKGVEAAVARIEAGEPWQDVFRTANTPFTAFETRSIAEVARADGRIRPREEAPTPAPPAEGSAYGANNKLVTQADREAIRARLRAKSGQLRTGIDPEMMLDGARLAVFHIEAGARAFADYAREIVADIGVEFRPYLRSWYEAARHWPGVDARGMTAAGEIEEAPHVAERTPETPEDVADIDQLLDTHRNDPIINEIARLTGAGWTPEEIENGPAGDRFSLDEIESIVRAQERRGEIPELDEAEGQGDLSFEEDEGGVQGAVPVRDEGAGPEDVHGAPSLGETGRAPSGEIGGGARTAEPAAGEEAQGQVRGAQPGGRAGGRGTGAGATDRVPNTGEGSAAGATRRFADRPDAGVEGSNFSIEPGDLAEGRGRTTKARDNIAAIELAKRLIDEGRPATKAEQAILVKYTGWGGIKNAFPDARGEFRPEMEDIGRRLRAALTDEEYRTAQQSVQYAHYTAEHVVRSMWDAVRQMGFDGGLVFEPGLGVGHFLGLMPADLAEKSEYQGIERDHLSAQIAKLLYPESGIREADYIRTPVPEGSFDLVIGNPPFGDIIINGDPKYAARGFMLHDYFFAKSLDSVRPGGLLAFITSAGTMNKLDASARLYLADRADLVGGIRLPNTTFRRNAGTEVTTDILFFRKRAPGEEGIEPAWTETVQRTLPSTKGGEQETNVSRYFSDHPENVLGTEAWGEMQAAGRYEVQQVPGTDLEADLRAAVDRLPRDVMTAAPTPEERARLDFASGQRKDGSFYVGADGKLMQYRDGAGREVPAYGKGGGGLTGAARERVEHLIPMRDALRDVFAADLARDDAAGAEARARLNEHYDRFVQKFGPINKAEFTYRRPSIIQQETARLEAREEARMSDQRFDDGEFDPSSMLANKAKVSEIARARQQAREAAKAAGREFDEGTFDPSAMPDEVSEKRPNIKPFMSDPESYRLRSIENYNDATGEASKKAIFRENILKHEEEPELKSANDGVLWSMNKLGRFDVDAIAKKMRREPADIVAELGDAVYKVPGTEDTYQTKDEYLSGDIVSKLETARAEAETDPDVRRNIPALEAALPPPLPPSEISMVLGMPWIPTDTLREFVRDHMEMGEPHISHSAITGTWFVNGGRAAQEAGVQRWSTPDRNAFELLSDAMNRTPPRIYAEERGPRGEKIRVFDPVATQAAQDVTDSMKAAFTDWVAADPDRANRLADLYNDKLNRTVLRQFDGSYMTTPGVAATWSWRPHQTRVVSRIVQTGNTYMAHAVGAGKTSAMIGAGMEMRRLGLVRKPLYVVPNHMLGQFTKEFYEQYPTARIAVADEDRFHTDRRKQFVANVAQDDLDAIIMTHSSFGKIGISDEFQRHLIDEQIEMLDKALEELDEQADRIARGRIENQKEKLEQRLSGRSDGQDQTLTFEQLGADFLFVDEAHQFRKLSFGTKQGNLKGIAPEGSNMAWDLYTKVRYLDSQKPGRSAVFASGTPVTNTMGELYSLSRFMQPEALAERGLTHFDSWAQTFGDTKTGLEETAAGTYQPVTRFGQFVNLPELYKMVGEVMDIVTPSQLEQYVTRPKLKGGERDFHLAPRTEILDRYQADLAARMQAIKDRRGPPQKGDDILLSVINDGRHAAIDPRFVEETDNDPRSKLNVMVQNVARIYHETADKQFYDPASNYERESFQGPATQMVFANLGVNGRGPMGFSSYQWIKEALRREGVAPEHIAFIGDYPGTLQRQALFNDMNEGKVRILVGSTQKMGTGVNAQRRLVALHNQDPLWFPADDEQRVGRILRQGNHNPEIEVHDYSTKGTYDSAMWKMMGNKARFIEQFFRGDPSLRNMEDVGEASMYEQASAMATTDERIITLTQLKQDLDKARRRESAHNSGQYALRSQLKNKEWWADFEARSAASIQEDIEKREDTRGDNFAMHVGGEKFDKRKEAEAALSELTADRAEGLGKGGETPVGRIGGFPIIMSRNTKGALSFNLRLSGGNARELNFNWYGNKSVHDAFVEAQRRENGEEAATKAAASPMGAKGLIQSAEHTLRQFEDRLAASEASRARALREADNIRPLLGQPFTGGDEILRLSNAVRDLEGQLRREAEAKANPDAPSPEPTPGIPAEPTSALPRWEGPTPEAVSGFMAGGGDLFQRLRQSIQGKIRISPGETRSIITLARSADASTFMHETAHDWLKQLLMDAAHNLAPQALRDDAATVRRWLKRPDAWTGFKRDGTPDVAPQERFARAFEQYLREGHAPSRALDGVFAKFKSWLTTIYRTLRGLGAPISDDIRGVFDRMLAIEPERITHGEVPERGPSIADIHEADAAETPPREAEVVADRIAAERARNQPPPEVAHEIAAVQPIEPAGATQPGAEAATGPTGRGEVAPGGGQPESVTDGSGVGAGTGAVGAGGGETAAEGTGVSGGTGQSSDAGGRRGTERAAGSPAEQLAPRPAESLDDTGDTTAVDLAGNIRVENLTDVESIAQAIHDSADRNDEFRQVRGGMTKGQMLDLAEAMGLDPNKIDEAGLARLLGGTSELGPRILAARRLVVQSAEIVSNIMKRAAQSWTDADGAELGLAIARHDMIQSALAGVTAEWGRAGNAFHNLLEGWGKAQDLNQLLRDNTGRDLYQLQVIAKMGSRLDTPGKVSKYLRDAKSRSFGGMILEYWINGLISGIATHATYVVGNTILAAEKAGPETAVAAAIGAFRARMGRVGTRVRLGEVGAQFGAAFREAPAAVQAGIEALRSGATTQLPGEAARPLVPFQGDTSLTTSRGMTNQHVTWREVGADAYGLVQGMRDGIVAAGELVRAGGVEGAPTWGWQSSPLGQIPGLAYKGVEVAPIGHILRLPSRNVAAIHSTFRAMNYSMEINALAFRQAADEGLAGEAFAARVSELRQNPPEEMMDAARGKATDLTLMGQGGKLTEALSRLFNTTINLPVLGETAVLKFVDPFVHIAGNIMNQSLLQRTPVGLLSREIRADLAGKNGNVAQDTAAAKMLVGTAIAVTFGGLAAQGLASGSGPADPNKAAMWRLAGNQPHSVRIGDMWYAVNRLGPMGLLLSVAADMYDVAHMMGTEDAGTIGSALMHAFTQNILDESFMRGPSDLIRATTESDRYGAAYIRNLLPSFLPFSVLQAQMARATDPYSRQARTIMDAIRARVPGLSESLFPRRDIWGEPMPSGDALIAPGVTAIYARQMSTDPVNLAMLALGVSPAPVERTIRNVKLTDQEYDDYARLAGRAAKIRLDAIVKSPLWATMPNASRYEVIEETIKQNREAARGMMMMKYPQIPRDAAKAQIARKTGETVH